MRVHQLTTGSEKLTAPFRSTNGVTLALRWGDICHPLGRGTNEAGQTKWFHPPYFSKVLQLYWSFVGTIAAIALVVYLMWLAANGICGYFDVQQEWVKHLINGVLLLLTLPATPGVWVSYRIGKRAGYYGWKIYGVDSDAYRNWLDPLDVYDGSQAMMLSIRPWAKPPT